MLLERDDDLRALDDALQRVKDTGRGEIVLVGAEAGGGKTSLVRAFACGADAAVWWGSCDNLRSPRPLGPLADIAASAGGPLARAFDGESPRRQIFDVTLETLRASTRCVVLVIEDLHWADDATLDLVTFLGRRIGSAPALLVLTRRNDEIGATDPVRAVLAEVAEGVHTRRQLAPLSADAVGRLAVDRSLDPAALHQRTGGNPFFVTECIAAGAASVPPSVAEAVLGRAARLAPAARLALDAAAIVPGRIELWLLDQLAGRASADVDQCVETGMLVAVEDGLAFRHELARIAVLEALPPARRRGLHRSALAALERAAPAVDGAQLAYHAEETGDRAAVLRHSPSAGEAAISVGAHRAAASHLGRAIRFVRDLPLGEQLRLQALLAHELHLLGREEESVAAYRAALDVARAAGDVRKEGELLVRIGAPLVSAGRQIEADAAARDATALLEPLGAGPELVAAYTAMASVHMLARELDQAALWGDRALVMAAELGHEPDLCHALIQTGVALLMGGDGATGMARLRRAIALARENGWDGLVALGLTQIGSGAGEVRRYDLAWPALIEATDWAESREMVASEPTPRPGWPAAPWSWDDGTRRDRGPPGSWLGRRAPGSAG